MAFIGPDGNSVSPGTVAVPITCDLVTQLSAQHGGRAQEILVEPGLVPGEVPGVRSLEGRWVPGWGSV